MMRLIPALMLAASAGMGPAAGHYGPESSFVWFQTGPQSPECRDWQACRQLALEAASRQDFDAFHDLAWRTLQAGPKNDPALMTMVARAQSLSGRPHDALVMLQRLAAMGVATDAATSDDFARVRALPAWADFETNAAGKNAAPPAPAKAPPTSAPVPDKNLPVAAPAIEPTRAPKTEKPVKLIPDAAPAPLSPKAETPAKAAARTSAPLTFSASGLTAVGLGYDAVSGRFIVGDRQERRLLVVGERSRRLASLAGIDAGFSEVTAFEIDTREGDLWVVSASSELGTSTLHKLQLISGRVLSSIELPSDQGPARFTDIAVTPEGILVLDSEGRRLFRAAKKGRTLEMAARLAASDVSSVAPASDTAAYASYDRGIVRIDLSTRAMTVVEASQRADLSGISWTRWHRGSLIAIQKASEGLYRIVRIRLDETGRMARALDVLVEDSDLAGPTSATVVGNVLYYLSRASNELEVKKLTLK